MQIYIHVRGKQRGPFSLDQINRALRGGSLTADSAMAWYEGCTDWIPLATVPGIAGSASAPMAPPPPAMAPAPPAATRDYATGGIIPYRNPCALIAYYLGIVGLIPAIGLVLSVPAVILGIIGLVVRGKNPAVRGKAHAWTGIVLGIISIGYHIAAIVLFLMNSPRMR